MGFFVISFSKSYVASECVLVDTFCSVLLNIIAVSIDVIVFSSLQQTQPSLLLFKCKEKIGSMSKNVLISRVDIIEITARIDNRLTLATIHFICVQEFFGKKLLHIAKENTRIFTMPNNLHLLCRLSGMISGEDWILFYCRT